MNNHTADAAIAGLDHSELWFELWHNPDSGDALTGLMEAYLPLVRRVLERMSIRLPPHIATDDLLQSASVGLYHSIARFDPALGISFAAFATPRIRGSILDELRAGDHASRGTRSTMRKIDTAIVKCNQEHGRNPGEEELAGELGMSTDELAAVFTRAMPVVSLDDAVPQRDGGTVVLRDLIADESSPSPSKQAETSEMRALLRRAFMKLTDRQQKVLYLYYYEELRLSEIAAIFEVTAARICQIHAMAVTALKALLGDNNADDA